MSQSSDIVEALIHNLTGRRGLGDEWDMIDSEIQSEIKDTWIEIVEEFLG